MGDRRREITDKLERVGIIRPVHASMNSRCNEELKYGIYASYV